MISLISGKYKGKKLYQFSNTYVRPTKAKIRKSIFQILEPFHGLSVLDLYAGVGTLGFEALSRGAALAVFVEKDHHVYEILEKNSTLFHNEKIKLHQRDALQFTSQTQNKGSCSLKTHSSSKTDQDISFRDPKKCQSSSGI